ncbi:hypothetical protein BS17DRAFT_845535 [Gyrodon lividus]|nr:hypothetical protein BS17DRAFT_845535 [Gyrodon lividus]
MEYSEVIDTLNATVATLQDQLTTMATEMQRVKDEKGTKELKFNKKFELTKLQVWITLNWDGFKTNQEIACAVWTRMKGPITGRYAETRMNNCLTKRQPWPKWTDLQSEVPKFFWPQTKIDWARATLQNMKQGNSQVDDYITKFLSLVTLSGISDEHGIYLLERNSKPEIIKQMYVIGQRKTTIQGASHTIREIGRAQELYNIQFGSTQGSTWFNNTKQSSAFSGGKTYGGYGEPMNVDAAQKGKCFNCGGPHMVRNCKAPKNPCKECKWLGGRHKNDCRQSKGKGRDICATDTERGTALPPSDPVAGMDYEAMKAYFYNMHVNELKAQGKGQGH